jgi:signal transduction histidine kinase
MSHELRTPLNSILILGQQLAENTVGNLTARQVDFARNIHSAGTDLLTLINDILDLSKIESGTVTVEAEEITFTSLRDAVNRTFHSVGESKGLPFHIDIDASLPRAFVSDPKRLHQILKNLLSNAFKFTAQGHVAMTVRQVTEGWSPEHPVLRYVQSAVDEPQVRRHRARPRDQPRAGDAARRRHPAGQLARPGQYVHAVPAVLVHGPGPRHAGAA